MYSIGIDIGTTNCKLCVFELPTLRLVDSYSFITPKITSLYGSDFDVVALYAQLEQGLIDIITALDQPNKVNNIVIASVGESGVLVDEYDNVVGPVITWYDTRTKVNLAEIKQKFTDAELYAITGIPVHSNYSLTKILWIRDNYQVDLQKIKWLCMAEYIAYKLTDVKRAELSLASRTLALDLKHQRWSTEIQQAFALDNLFADLIPSGQNFSKIKLALAQKITGIGDVYVAIGGHDHMCGSIAAQLQPGEILNSTGTTEGLLLLTPQANFSQPFLASHLSNGAYVDNQLHTLYTSLPAAGYCVEWFKNTFSVGNDDFNQLIVSLQHKVDDVAYIKNNLGIFIPHLRGSGPPHRNIDAKGLWYGFSERSNRENILLIILQGLCFELRHILETVETLTSTQHAIIKVIGAASKNPVWLQLKADILGRKIVSCNIKEAVCKGAVMLAGYKNGYLSEPASQPQPNQQSNHQLNPQLNPQQQAQLSQYEPNNQLVGYYDQIFTQYYQPMFALKNQLESHNMKDR